VSDSLGLHARLFCLPASLRICLNSCPLTWWVMLSNHLILCHPLLLLPSVFPQHFSNELALRIRWPKCWSFSFHIGPSNEYSWLISFRMDWLDLLAVQGTLKSLFQHNNSKASILWHSDFFMISSGTSGKLLLLK